MSVEYFILRPAILSYEAIDNNTSYSEGDVVNPDVNGATIKNSEVRMAFTEKTINRRNIHAKLPLIDHFYCYNGSDNIEYDWLLLDAYYTTGAEVPIDIDGFLISKKFKNLLEQSDLVLGSKHHFYPALLRFKGELLEYYLFQYCYDSDLMVNWQGVKLVNHGESYEVSNSSEYYSVYREFKIAKDLSEFYSTFPFDDYSDILRLPSFGYQMISEKFKNLILTNKIHGFKITEVDFLRLQFNNLKF
jgi:hypothetical protein